jgi:hypothetical protein
MYTLVSGMKRFEEPTRQGAVRRARELSKHRRSPVKVIHRDGYEKMVYRSGALVEGVRVTRDRRGKVGRLR